MTWTSVPIHTGRLKLVCIGITQYGRSFMYFGYSLLLGVFGFPCAGFILFGRHFLVMILQFIDSGSSTAEQITSPVLHPLWSYVPSLSIALLFISGPVADWIKVLKIGKAIFSVPKTMDETRVLARCWVHSSSGLGFCCVDWGDAAGLQQGSPDLRWLRLMLYGLYSPLD